MTYQDVETRIRPILEKHLGNDELFIEIFLNELKTRLEGKKIENKNINTVVDYMMTTNWKELNKDGFKDNLLKKFLLIMEIE